MKGLTEVISRQYPRDELVDTLTRYNDHIGNDEIARANIFRLKDQNSVCVFTGQQLGFMGGPAYTLYKAIGCLQVAKKYDAIPIFWMATEDHDIAEVDHTYTVDDLGNIEKHKITLPSEGVVEDLVLTRQNVEEIDAFCSSAGVDLSKLNPSSGELFAEVMARLLVEVFKSTGMVFMEPRLVRHHAEELFLQEIKGHQEIRRILLETTEGLKKSGAPTPIEIQSDRTNLFYKGQDNKRLKVSFDERRFRIGRKEYSEDELIEHVQRNPSAFSGNVSLRPIIQSFIFPTLAYIAGPTEVSYYRQLEQYFEYHGVPLPEVISRPSLTCLNEKSMNYLEMINLHASYAIPQDWSEIFSELEGKDKKEVKRFLEEKNIPYNALHYLQNYLHPFNKKQERTLSWLWLNAQSNYTLVDSLLRGEDHKSIIINETTL